MTIKIEKGIPVPAHYQRGMWAVLDDMKVGDSFAVPAIFTQRVRMAISQRKRRGGKAEFITRTVGDQLRVWRTK